jgi:hypothetical protein
MKATVEQFKVLHRAAYVTALGKPRELTDYVRVQRRDGHGSGETWACDQGGRACDLVTKL